MYPMCRPIGGNANFCPSRILSFPAEDYIRVALHELTHALVGGHHLSSVDTAILFFEFVSAGLFKFPISLFP